MVSSRTATAALGILFSLAVSAVVWIYFDTLLVFLVVPFVPLLLGRGEAAQPTVYECPTCGFTTTDPAYAYCPRDGTELQASE